MDLACRDSFEYFVAQTTDNGSKAYLPNTIEGCIADILELLVLEK
jgi:hypothetical protein